jgi:CBS domain-containing protein
MIETVCIGNAISSYGLYFCNNNPVTLERDKTLYDAQNILIKYNISRVVILNEKEHNRPAGIVTEKDTVRFLHAEFPRKGLAEIRLDEIITNQHLITVEGGTNVSICAKLMLDINICSLVVPKGNNGDGILSGIITKSDLFGDLF